MRPKFEVGEIALLRSENFPECNGEYTISAIYNPGFAHESEGGRKVIYRSPTYTYELNCSVIQEGGLISKWQEKSLRKKHTPGEMTFDNLMASLSSPKLLTHQPQ